MTTVSSRAIRSVARLSWSLAVVAVLGCNPTSGPGGGNPPAAPTGNGDVSTGLPTRGPTVYAVAGKPLIATPRGPAIANQLVVEVGAAGVAQLRREVDALGGEIAGRTRASRLYVAGFPDAKTASAAIPVLRTLPGVVDVSRNIVMAGSGISTSPSLVAQEWNLPAMGIDPNAGDLTAAGIRVAVIDSGVAYENYSDASGTYALAPDLAGVTFLPGIDLVNGDNHPDDDEGHGTQITGVIAAQNGIASVAPGAEIIPIKVLDNANLGTELGLAEGILRAMGSGAQVINLSLSFPPSYFPSHYLQKVVEFAARKGVVIVAAAGNQGANMVTYPAAFRDVIAVGASQLAAHYRQKPGQTRWEGDADALERAGYSNRGNLLDVVAPGGSISRDVDGDGNPEGILAQTFSSDPTDFGYYFYAGTSEAAAEVSGIAANLLAQNPNLSPSQVRQLVGDTARRHGAVIFDSDTGRGYVQAGRATAQASDAAAIAPHPHYYAAIHLDIEQAVQTCNAGTLPAGAPTPRDARAVVDIIDGKGNPVPNVKVYGTFTGGVYASQARRTNHAGEAMFRSPLLGGGGHLVSFEVDAVADKSGDFDRPSGFFRTDSCSLDALTTFANQISTFGISTSPSFGPLTLSLPRTRKNQVPSLTLLNFSWGLATVPMAVVVDAAWFRKAFPNSGALEVKSLGTGIGSSRLVFDPDQSFPQPVNVGSGNACVDVIVRTFMSGSGISTSPSGPVTLGISTSPSIVPLIPDPDGNCADTGSCQAYLDVLQGFWNVSGAGISTSPSWGPSSGISESAFDYLAQVIQSYIDFGRITLSEPVEAYRQVLIAAGVGLAPFDGSAQAGVGDQLLK